MATDPNSTQPPVPFGTPMLLESSMSEFSLLESGNAGQGPVGLPTQPWQDFWRSIAITATGIFNKGITITFATAYLTMLEAAGLKGFRWILNNDGTLRLQRSLDGFATILDTPILIDANGVIVLNKGSVALNAFAFVTLLESAVGKGFRWTLLNNGTLALQRSLDGFVTVFDSPLSFDTSGRPVIPLNAGAGKVLTSDGAGVGTWQTPAAAVTSVFGRTGAVVAVFGDYSFFNLSGGISTGQGPAAGFNGAITTAKLTPGGANGSMTFVAGWLTASTPAT